MGAAFGAGFTALANQLALMGLGVATLGLVDAGPTDGSYRAAVVRGWRR